MCAVSIGLVLFVGGAAATGSSNDALPFTVGTPQLAQITSTAQAQAPWNEYQGDTEAASYASNGAGTVYPTYTPGGVTTGSAGSATNPLEPNIAVFPGADSTTVNDAPYPAGVVGTPGTLDDYCGSGSNAVEGDQPVAAASVSRQPVGTLPLAPAYFPHVVENPDGSLTGYFDYRPKDADEAIVAGTSTDNGRTWTYDGEALEGNPGYCPTADTTDDGEGHANLITVSGNTFLYTLPRAAGDEEGVGMIVHQFSPTEQNPLGDLPTTETVGIDPDAFVPTGSASVKLSTTSRASIPLTSVGTPGSPEQLISGSFIDLTQDPNGTAPTIIDCTVSSSPAELTGCATPASTFVGTGTITVNAGDLIEQVIGFTTKSSDLSSTNGPIPAGPNNTLGSGGNASLTVTPLQATTPADGYSVNQFADPVTGNMFNADAPIRLFINGKAIYCTNADSAPVHHIENCTAGAGNPAYNITSAWEPITADPIIPATAYDTAAGDGMTGGLIAPDGIVGTLPSYPESNPALVGSNPTFVMYTTKELGYYLAGITTNASATAFGAGTFTVDSTPGMYIAQDLPNATGPDTLSIGATPPSGDTTDSPTIIQMTCSTVAESTGTFSGCTVPSTYATWTYATSSYLGAPGAAISQPAVLQKIGEGSATSITKLWKNNEDISVLRIAWTTNGVTFSSAGLANGGVISGENNCQSGSPDAICGSSANSADPSAPYDDINNPAEQTSPSNLNGYADNDAANGTGSSTGGTDAGGVPDADEMRWVGSAGSIIDNNGTDEMFLSGAWAADGDSDSFNQIFYSTSSNGEYWTVPTPVLSTDYSFAASIAQDGALASGQDDPLGISAYYSGRAYAPSVVQNPDGTLTMVFGGDRIPKSIAAAGTLLGTGATQYTIGAEDPALYRNILSVSLQPASAAAIATTTAVASTVNYSTTVGDAITYTATVSSSSDGGPPTGTVSFATTSGVITGCGSVALSQLTPDAATCTTSYTGPVDDALQAVYSGDSLFAGSSNYVDTTTTLSSSDGGLAVAGETVTYSATVADAKGGADPAPTGTVTFSDTAGNISSCSAQSLELVGLNEVATCSVLYPTVLSSPDVVSATYNGDAATFGSTSSLNETVGQASTTTSLSSSDNGSAVVGEQVTFTATVGVDAPGSGVPTGTVNFSDSAGAIAGCSGVVVSGGSPDTATCQTTYTAAMTGPDAISAVYTGDSNYLTSAASSFAESVNPASTTTALSASPHSVVVGQSVTITAKIGIVAPGAGSPTGSVAFADSAGVVGAACPSQSVSEVAGVFEAACTVSFPAALTSSDVISAAYSGDNNFAGSPAPTIELDVNQASTSTTIETSDATPVVGEQVTYTATVGITSPGLDVPTGSVDFVGHSGTISGCGAAPLSATAPFVATCTTLYGSPGTDSVSATYSGDGNNLGSSSSSVAETIGKDSTTTTLGATPDPAVSGMTTVLSATILVDTPGSSTPGGTVTFYQGAKVLCGSAAVSAGVATCSFSYAKATSSPYELTAVYSGDTNELGSTSAAISLSVSHATHLNLSATPSPASYGHRITLHAGGVPAAATGTVTFSVGATELCSLPVSSGGETCVPTSPLAPGLYTITADYSGDANYAPATATASLTVVIASTAITLHADPASFAYGTPVALDAGNIPALATGTVTFAVAGSTVCTAAAGSPSVSCALSALAPGTYAVSAAYSGDGNFAPSNASASLTVRKAAAHFSASATPASAAASQDISLDASNLPHNATGTVSFTTGSTALCSATVSGGLASCAAPAGLSARTYHVTAHYSGDVNYNSATATTSFAVSS